MRIPKPPELVTRSIPVDFASHESWRALRHVYTPSFAHTAQTANRKHCRLWFASQKGAPPPLFTTPPPNRSRPRGFTQRSKQWHSFYMANKMHPTRDYKSQVFDSIFLGEGDIRSNCDFRPMPNPGWEYQVLIPIGQLDQIQRESVP